MTGVPGRSRAAACITSHGLTVVSLECIAVRFGSVWVGRGVMVQRKFALGNQLSRRAGG